VRFHLPQAIRLTLEKVHYVHRPLVFYVFLTGAQLVGHAVLRLMGFRRHEVNGIAYWYRNQAPSARNATTAKVWWGDAGDWVLHTQSCASMAARNMTVRRRPLGPAKAARLPHHRLDFLVSRVGETSCRGMRQSISTKADSRTLLRRRRRPHGGGMGWMTRWRPR
jgi:hypothetical protein